MPKQEDRIVRRMVLAKKYPYYGLKAYIELKENGVKVIFTEKDIKKLVLIRPNDGSSISFGEENGNK